jgi:hypothetical protein
MFTASRRSWVVRSLPRRQASRRPAAAPNRRLLDHAAALGDRDDVLGRHPATNGVPPAKQNFGARQLSRPVDLGLIVELQFIIAERRLQIRRKGEAVLQIAACSAQTAGEPPVPEPFRCIHGQIGVLEQIIDALLCPLEQSEADAGRGLERVVVKQKRLVNGGKDVSGHDLRLFAGATFVSIEVPDEHHEFVAAVTGDEILVPHARAYPSGNFGQKEIADMMALGVVQRLEVIEVDEKHCPERPVRALAEIAWPRQSRNIVRFGSRVSGSEISQFMDARLGNFRSEMSVRNPCQSVLPSASRSEPNGLKIPLLLGRSAGTPVLGTAIRQLFSRSKNRARKPRVFDEPKL